MRQDKHRAKAFAWVDPDLQSTLCRSKHGGHKLHPDLPPLARQCVQRAEFTGRKAEACSQRHSSCFPDPPSSHHHGSPANAPRWPVGGWSDVEVGPALSFFPSCLQLSALFSKSITEAIVSAPLIYICMYKYLFQTGACDVHKQDSSAVGTHQSN